MKIILAVLMVLTMASLSSAATQSSADVIFINGDIYLGAPHIELRIGAVRPKAVRSLPANGRVTGHRCYRAAKSLLPELNEEIQKLKGPKTQVVDLGGHFVMPGFNDAHVHLGSGGFEKLNVNLVGSKSLDDMKQRIAARVKTAARANGLSAAAGTIRCGRNRKRQLARTLTQ